MEITKLTEIPHEIYKLLIQKYGLPIDILNLRLTCKFFYKIFSNETRIFAIAKNCIGLNGWNWNYCFRNNLIEEIKWLYKIGKRNNKKLGIFNTINIIAKYGNKDMVDWFFSLFNENDLKLISDGISQYSYCRSYFFPKLCLNKFDILKSFLDCPFILNNIKLLSNNNLYNLANASGSIEIFKYLLNKFNLDPNSENINYFQILQNILLINDISQAILFFDYLKNNNIIHQIDNKQLFKICLCGEMFTLIDQSTFIDDCDILFDIYKFLDIELDENYVCDLLFYTIHNGNEGGVKLLLKLIKQKYLFKVLPHSINMSSTKLIFMRIYKFLKKNNIKFKIRDPVLIIKNILMNSTNESNIEHVIEILTKEQNINFKYHHITNFIDLCLSNINIKALDYFIDYLKNKFKTCDIILEKFTHLLFNSGTYYYSNYLNLIEHLLSIDEKYDLNIRKYLLNDIDHIFSSLCSLQTLNIAKWYYKFIKLNNKTINFRKLDGIFKSMCTKKINCINGHALFNFIDDTNNHNFRFCACDYNPNYSVDDNYLTNSVNDDILSYLCQLCDEYEIIYNLDQIINYRIRDKWWINQTNEI